MKRELGIARWDWHAAYAVKTTNAVIAIPGTVQIKHAKCPKGMHCIK